MKTGTLPDEWARQDPQDVVTALMILDEWDSQARKGQP